MTNRIKRSARPIALAGWIVFALVAQKWLWGCGTEWPWPVDPSGDTVTYEVVSVFGVPVHDHPFHSYYPQTITLSLSSAKNPGPPWIGEVQFQAGIWLSIIPDAGSHDLFRVDSAGWTPEEFSLPFYTIRLMHS